MIERPPGDAMPGAGSGADRAQSGGCDAIRGCRASISLSACGSTGLTM